MRSPYSDRDEVVPLPQLSLAEHDLGHQSIQDLSANMTEVKSNLVLARTGVLGGVRPCSSGLGIMGVNG